MTKFHGSSSRSTKFAYVNAACPSCGGSAVSYTYDQLNRPVSTTQSFDGKAYTLDYAYDAVGNRTAMATPWGKYSYTYDALNRLTNIVNPQGITVAFGYDAAGRRTSKKIFKAAPALLAETEYNYDAAGQLTEIVNKAGNKVVPFNKYQYDANGNRTRIEDQDGIWDYKYDAANRLIVAIPWPVDYVKAEAFVYDKNGNRRYDKTAWDYHYDAANRLVENSTYTYTHDANGNLTARTNRFDNIQFTYAYTPEQQLSEVTTPEHKVQYKYDPLGRRTEKVVDGKTTKFIYDGQDIIAELDDNNAAINTYTNGPGIDEPLIMTKPDGKAYYYHADALGSIKAITDDNANIVETYKYKAYGQPTIRDPKRQPLVTSIIGNTRMFAAREYEQEIALYNNRHRYLDPSRGTFTQEDLSGIRHGLNLYKYGNSSPVNYVDPTGFDAILISYPDYMVDIYHGFRLPLGHGAIIAVNPLTGDTRYFEYGRYEHHIEGIVLERIVPKLKMENGKPTEDSLFNLYYFISVNYGQGGQVNPIYVTSADSQKVIDYAATVMTDPNREKYSILTNNCKTFAKDAVLAGKE